MAKKNILLFLTFLSTIYLFSQSELTTQSNYKVNYFTIEEGLSNNKVNAICKDKYGFIWFGTNEGLDRYDGYNIISYQNDKSDTLSISNNLIRSILEDRDGRLWIGTDDGLNLYDPEINGFQQVAIGNKHHDLNFVWQLFEDKNGILWIATHHGLYYKEIGSTKIVAFKEFNTLTENPHVISVYLDSHNNLWAGTREHGLLFYSFNSNESKQFINVPYDKTSLSGNWIQVIYEDKNGDLWIGASKDGLYSYNYETLSFTRVPVDDNLSNNETIRDISEDKYGRLWVGTQSGL